MPWSLSRRAAAFIALAAAVVLFVAVNFIADRVLRGTRIDLTEHRLYTLSEGTRKTLAEIKEPVVLRFYFSPRLGNEIPSYGVYAQRVREMLEEYAAISNGKIELQLLNPEPFSPTEDRAEAFGLQGVALDQGGEQVYFGLAATNSTDDQQIVPFFQPDRERFLEYDLTKLIHSLAFPKKPVIGLVTKLPVLGDMMAALQGQPAVPYAVIGDLSQLYTVRSLSTEFDTVPDDIDMLTIVHPQNLSNKTLYAIDQFVMKGGRALVFVDPDSETQRMHPYQFTPPQESHSSDLNRLLNSWGVEMMPNMVAGDLEAAQKVNASTGTQIIPAVYVAWLALPKSDLNPDDPVTGNLDRITMMTAGVLEAVKGAKTTFTPLISTSTASEEIPVAKIQGMPDVQALLRAFKPDGKRLVLAARVTGPAGTAFPDGPPKEEAKPAEKGAGDAAPPKAAKLPPQIKTALHPLNIIVVADTDILDDRFWVEVKDFFGQRVTVPFANNGDFVDNAVDALVGGGDLISLRSRGTSARPFTLVDNIQRAADEKYQATAKDLEDKLKDSEAKIKSLRDAAGKAGVTEAAGERDMIDNFRTQMIRTREQLRSVQLAERQDIDRLRAWVEFFNIAAIPILVTIAAAIVGIVRLERRKRHARTASAAPEDAAMRNKGLISLIAVTLITVAVSVYVGEDSWTLRESPLIGTPVLPEVGKRIDEVGRIALVHAGIKTTLLRRGKGWVVGEKSDYPANDTKVDRALLGLAGMTYVEMKTRTPALYPRLEVEDADKKDAKSTLVTVADEKGSLRGEVIVGKTRIDQLGGGNDGVYVRKPGGAQSWLARGTLDLTGDTVQWLDHSLIDLPEAKVKDVVLTRADGTKLAFRRDKPADNFALAVPLPAGKKLKDNNPLDPPASALAGLELTDVQPAKNFGFPKTGVAEARYESFDGLIVTVSVMTKDSIDWARIAVAGSGAAAKQAAALEAKFEPWVFAIASDKAEALATKLGDVIEPAKGS